MLGASTAQAASPNAEWLAHHASPTERTARGAAGYGYGYGYGGGGGYGYGGGGGYGYGGGGGYGCDYGGYGGYGGSCTPRPVNVCGPGDSAVISNGLIELGVCKLGELNVPNAGPPSAGEGTRTVGLRYLPLGLDAISPGCPCEGWGAADEVTGQRGWSNQSRGTSGLVPLSFTHDARTATSVVSVGGRLKVTQAYRPSSSTSYLYEDTVTIENTSAAPVVPRYRRVMDWDVEPTAFEEYVTIKRGNAADLVATSDDGFATPDPLSAVTKILFTGEATDSGPADHGALFDFRFASLAPGASRTFRVFYGAAPGESQALAATSAVGAEAYSMGESSLADGPTQGKPATFIFAFSGVGGQPIPNALSVSPSAARKHLGDAQRMVATAVDSAGHPLAGKTVVWRVTGANTASGSAVTNADGRAAIEYVGTSAGDDEAELFVDDNHNGTREPDEPRAEAEVRWEPDVVASAPTASVPALPSGAPVSLASYVNPATDLTYFTIPASQAAQFPGGCVPFTAETKLVAGGGTIANATLVLRRRDGTQSTAGMTSAAGVYRGTLPCAATGDLSVEYDLTEAGTTHHYAIPLGGLVLVDPQGIVYDAAAYAAAIGTGSDEASARAAAAVPGATVTLQRLVDGAWTTVPSGDPGISPNVNPEVTGADGKYAWDVSAGHYRVVVSAGGFDTVTSREIDVPPPVLDLHVGLTRPAAPGGGGLTPTAAQVVTPVLTKGLDIGKVTAALDARLSPTGKDARLARIAKQRGYATTVALPAAGKVTFSWYTKPKGKSKKRTLVARGVASSTKADVVKLAMKLTPAGRKLVAAATKRPGTKLRLDAEAVFESAGSAPIVRTRSITLRR